MPSIGNLQQLMRRYPEAQLATLVQKPPEGAEWLHEIKLDGYRLLGFVAGGRACLRTRNGKDWTERFPAIAEALAKIKADNAVLDMEAVVMDSDGKSRFQSLQEALSDGGNPREIVAFAFDLLHLDGRDLTKRPLTERKELLKQLLGKLNQRESIRYSEHILGQGSEMYSKACGMGLEGMVSKKADAPYIAGRQKAWQKTKCSERQEFIILGYSKARTGDRALGALYLGYRREGKLLYAGKVGTGFSMNGARDLAKRLEPLAVAKPLLTRTEAGDLPGIEWQSIRWVKPVLVCEVTFTEWTAQGRIRDPSFEGVREDKKASDVRKEMPVKSASRKNAGALVVAGVAVTHPDRVVSSTGHVTKGELAEYYAAVAPFLLPGIVRRPLSLLRCPAGIDGGCFYQRNPGKGLGPDVFPFKFKHKGKTFEYLYIEDEKGLLEVVQMGAIELHPWGARIDAIDYPDRLIFDLDPAPDVSFEVLKRAAMELRQRLQEKGLESHVKCTGGKGLHVTVALAGEEKWPEVKAFAALVAQEMAAEAPDAYVATMSKAKRTGKIFIDYLRNDYTATAIADFAVRALPGAPVAVPLDWNELKSLKAPNQFAIKDVLGRLNSSTQFQKAG